MEHKKDVEKRYITLSSIDRQNDFYERNDTNYFGNVCDF